MTRISMMMNSFGYREFKMLFVFRMTERNKHTIKKLSAATTNTTTKRTKSKMILKTTTKSTNFIRQRVFCLLHCRLSIKRAFADVRTYYHRQSSISNARARETSKSTILIEHCRICCPKDIFVFTSNEFHFDSSRKFRGERIYTGQQQ